MFQLPPAPPPASQFAPVSGEIATPSSDPDTECERGSRDCFPKDLVGVLTTGVVAPAPISLSLTDLLHP